MVYETTDKTKKLEWDWSSIFQEEVNHYIKEDGVSEDEAAELVGIFRTFEYHWNQLICELGKIMENVSVRFKHRYTWKAKGLSLGWRKSSGEKTFDAEYGADFLKSILPETENTFEVFVDRNTIIIHNRHHDAPVNPEIYIIRNITAEEFEKEE